LPSIVLGTFEASPLELAVAFSPLATHGTLSPAVTLQRVLNAHGEVLYRSETRGTRVATPVESYLVRDMMRGVLEHGTARSARELGYSFPAAGKTGTTDDGRDAWFLGFDADVLAIVWVGADQAGGGGLSGGKAALPIWVDLMKKVRGTRAPPDDPLPAGLEAAQVCAETGVLAGPQCPLVRRELFWPGGTPGETCTLHVEASPEGEAVGPLQKLKALLERFRD
jgi:membrane peptidoglycan carboxypeptidase